MRIVARMLGRAALLSMLVTGCAKSAPPVWESLGLPLEAKTCADIHEVNKNDPRSVVAICPGKAAAWQVKYAALTAAGWVETGSKYSATHLIEKSGTAVDWTVQQHTDDTVRVTLNLRTPAR
jgi:hypothetical protein